MYNFIKHYDNPEKFNEDFIFQKRNDNVLDYLNDICKALEVVNGIKYLGGSIIKDESEFKTKGKEGEKWMDVEQSRLNMVRLKFELTNPAKDAENPVEIIEKDLYFPKLINDFYFLINGTKYFPIYQIIDAGTYKTPKSLTLKSLLMPINMKTSKVKFFDVEDKIYEHRVFILDLFKYKINILNYYFAKMGVDKTIEYFGYTPEDIGFLTKEEYAATTFTDVKYFGLSESVYMYVKESVFNSTFGRDFTACMIDSMASKIKLEKIYNQEYWVKQLGKVFTKNTSAYVEKAEKILISFNRILDDRTKTNLRIPAEDKEDIYTIVRWMSMNHDTLSRMDNMDLKNKRLRLYEYLLHPLLIKFSNSTYRLLNNKTLTMTNLKSLFSNISPGFLVKKLITNELLRYYNTVNNIDLFGAALKCSMRGPQSISEGSKSVAVRYRGLHGSYLGRVGLAASSNTDPGMSFTFTPFCQTDGFYFVTEEEYQKQFVNTKGAGE